MTTMKLRRLCGLLAAAGAMGLMTQAHAAQTCPETNDPAANYKCFYFDTQTDFDGSGSSKTSSFYQMGYNTTLATSIYTPFNPLVSGWSSNIVDSNIKGVINYYGLSGGATNYTTLSGSTVSLKDTPSFPGQQNIDTLQGDTPPARDTNRFDAQDDAPLVINKGWGMTYQTFLTGTLDASGPHFTGGYIDLFYQNWVAGTSEQVLRIKITGSTISQANLDLYGKVSFDWTGGGLNQYGLQTPDGVNDCTTSLCQNFLNLQTTVPHDFYSLEGMGIAIQMHLDTNVSPPIPTASQLVARGGTDSNTYWIRQTTLDGSIEFNTPEPGTLALAGLALVGLGVPALRRARKG